MKIRLIHWLTLLVLLMSAQAAQALLISCSVSSAGFTSGYVTSPVNSASFIVTQNSFDVTCSRGSTILDGTTSDYTVTANDGANPSGNINRGASGGARINYDLYIDSACGTKWQAATSIPSPAQTITMTGLAPTTVTKSFWSCIPAGQAPVAGTYTDTVIMTVSFTGGGLVTTATGTFPVTIIVPATCSISSAPGTVAFTYTAFSAAAVAANTTFGVICSNSLPYNMSVSPATGAVAGINYALSLTPSSVGTGLAQTFTITGNAPANQAGTCTTGSCSASQVATLTITY